MLKYMPLTSSCGLWGNAYSGECSSVCIRFRPFFPRPDLVRSGFTRLRGTSLLDLRSSSIGQAKANPYIAIAQPQFRWDCQNWTMIVTLRVKLNRKLVL